MSVYSTVDTVTASVDVVATATRNSADAVVGASHDQSSVDRCAIHTQSNVVGLLFDHAKHTALRRRSRAPLAGLPIGTLPNSPQQNIQLGAPFALSECQLRNLNEDPNAVSNLVVIAGRSVAAATRPIEAARDLVFQDLSNRGYFVMSGLRHGFDFVVYEGDPVRHHGSHFVAVVHANAQIPCQKMVLWNRLAASARKTAILATVDCSGSGGSVPRYLLISGEER